MVNKSILLSKECYDELTKILILLESKNYESLIKELIDKNSMVVEADFHRLVVIADKLMKGKKSNRKNEKLTLILDMFDVASNDENREKVLLQKMRIEEYLNEQKKVISNDLHQE